MNQNQSTEKPSSNNSKPALRKVNSKPFQLWYRESFPKRLRRATGCICLWNGLVWIRRQFNSKLDADFLGKNQQQGWKKNSFHCFRRHSHRCSPDSARAINVLNASMFEIALVSVIQGCVTIALQTWGGKLVDRVGRKPLIIMSRLGLVRIPIFCGLASSVYHLYLSSLIVGVLVSFGDVAMLSCLLGVTREEFGGTLTAFYNLATGIVFFLGAINGGYLANYLLEHLVSCSDCN